jgi:hypothetical protein
VEKSRRLQEKVRNSAHSAGYDLVARSPIAVAAIAMTALMIDSPAMNPEASATL